MPNITRKTYTIAHLPSLSWIVIAAHLANVPCAALAQDQSAGNLVASAPANVLGQNAAKDYAAKLLARTESLSTAIADSQQKTQDCLDAAAQATAAAPVTLDPASAQTSVPDPQANASQLAVASCLSSYLSSKIDLLTQSKGTARKTVSDLRGMVTQTDATIARVKTERRKFEADAKAATAAIAVVQQAMPDRLLTASASDLSDTERAQLADAARSVILSQIRLSDKRSAIAKADAQIDRLGKGRASLISWAFTIEGRGKDTDIPILQAELQRDALLRDASWQATFDGQLGLPAVLGGAGVIVGVIDSLTTDPLPPGLDAGLQAATDPNLPDAPAPKDAVKAMQDTLRLAFGAGSDQAAVSNAQTGEASQ